MKKQLLTAAATAGFLFNSFSGSASAHEKLHTVQSGDSLWKLSQTYNVAINDIKTWNKLSTNTIYVNQRLSFISQHSHTSTMTVSTNTTKTTYIVKYGDTLWGISKAYRLSIAELKSLNGLRTDSIFPGQKMKVSGVAPAAATTSSTYIVRNGDNLSIIASRHNLPLSKLKSINNLKSDVIYPGQVLTLSGQAVAPVAKNAVNKGTTVMATYSKASKVEALITEAKKHIGVPYVWAGNTPSGFDCSGYLKYVYDKVGLTVPRTVETIWNATKPISSLRAGDLVFFETYKTGPSHAGIYIGNNKFIHAGTSRGVEISDMDNTYWKPRYIGAKTTF